MVCLENESAETSQQLQNSFSQEYTFLALANSITKYILITAEYLN